MTRPAIADARPNRVRSPRRGETPTFSVVLASRHERATLEGCLVSLRSQCASVGAELIVARAGTASEIAALTRSVPDVRFIAAPHDASMAQLRGLGMSEATGDIVALLDDHGITDELRTELMLREIAERDSVGRLTRTDRTTSTDWAAYLATHGIAAATSTHAAGTPSGAGAALVQTLFGWFRGAGSVHADGRAR